MSALIGSAQNLATVLVEGGQALAHNFASHGRVSVITVHAYVDLT